MPFAIILFDIIKLQSVIFNPAICHYAFCHSLSCYPAICNLAICHYAFCHLLSCHLQSCHLPYWHLPSCHLPSCHFPHAICQNAIAIRLLAIIYIATNICYWSFWKGKLLELSSFMHKNTYFMASNEIRKYKCPSSGFCQLVYQLSGSVICIESLHIMTPDNTLGTVAHNVHLSVSNLLCYSSLLI